MKVLPGVTASEVWKQLSSLTLTRLQRLRAAVISSGIRSLIAPLTAQERRSPAGQLSLWVCVCFLFLFFFLTVAKPLRRKGMQLAGYFCATTEEVGGESQDPAPPKKHSSLPPFFFLPFFFLFLFSGTSNESREKSRQETGFLQGPLCLLHSILSQF